MATNMSELLRRMVSLEKEAFQEFADHFGPPLRQFLMHHGFTEDISEAKVVKFLSVTALQAVKESSNIEEGGLEGWVWLQARDIMVECWQSTKWSPKDLETLLAIKGLIDRAFKELSDSETCFVNCGLTESDEIITKLASENNVTEAQACDIGDKARNRLRSVLQLRAEFRMLLSICKKDRPHL